MKAVAYSIKIFEKEFLAKANNKKHDITLISNVLSMQTAIYARGKEAVIVNTTDDVSDAVIKILADFGVKYITTRSIETNHIDKAAAAKYGIKLANVPYLQQSIAAETILSNSQTILPQKVLQQIGDQTIRNLNFGSKANVQGKPACVQTDVRKYKPDLNMPATGKKRQIISLDIIQNVSFKLIYKQNYQYKSLTVSILTN